MRERESEREGGEGENCWGWMVFTADLVASRGKKKGKIESNLAQQVDRRVHVDACLPEMGQCQAGRRFVYDPKVPLTQESPGMEMNFSKP